MMIRFLYLLLSVLCLAACTADDALTGPADTAAVPLKGIEASVYGSTAKRAPALDKDYHVGRSVFVNADQMVLTTIKRTMSPIPGFTYSGIVFDHTVGAGQTTGGWDRDENRGGTEANPTQVPDAIYWSDATNPHTYIGYSLPQPRETFAWTLGEHGIYSGTLRSIGSETIDDVVTRFVDHTTDANIKADDLLLTYDTDKVSETGGSVAKLYFHHALANVRVIVNIMGFSASNDAADTRSVVSHMVLRDMPVRYRWMQQSTGVTPLPHADNETLDTRMWIPRPDGTGTGVGKQFVFYALAVPRADVSQQMTFDVSYPDPMNPDVMLTKTYRAAISPIEYRAGYCTTIHISLNHKDEEITVGAEYMDWQYVETPDNGELKKNTVLLTADMLKRSNFTLAGDPKANEDDATWLYINPKTGKLTDIYGNDGSVAAPFSITTASQLVSFAHEVKGTNRVTSTYTRLDGTQATLTNGFNFKGYYVHLDADIVLQPSLFATADQRVEWCSIGEGTCMFDGNFLGGKRSIRHLYGKPLFDRLGSEAVVEALHLYDVIEVDGRGLVANESDGFIAAIFAEGTIRQKVPSNNAIYSGSLVGTVGEKGGLISCAHVGDVEAWAEGDGVIGGLVGYNKGLLISCYHSGKEKNLAGSDEHYHTYAGVGKYDPDDSYAYCCYFNKDADPDKSDFDVLVHGKMCFPVSIEMIQSNKFVNGTEPILTHELDGDQWYEQHLSLNQGLQTFYEHLVAGTIPSGIYNPSHEAWFKVRYESYKFYYAPGFFPRVY